MKKDVTNVKNNGPYRKEWHGTYFKCTVCDAEICSPAYEPSRDLARDKYRYAHRTAGKGPWKFIDQAPKEALK